MLTLRRKIKIFMPVYPFPYPKTYPIIPYTKVLSNVVNRFIYMNDQRTKVKNQNYSKLKIMTSVCSLMRKKFRVCPFVFLILV